ncbi:hypothetical protein [Swingsia samuiensis]|uniref:Uncharacterized protein n=1 Tax=Swingsia samuiensis TaxID=1293412 RepID=A0A4Y6UGX2_9PROT|nr:hypothetical protein [Swingsia samuiensis]QDH16822.1 hypothetical protein E3D00_03990 [Swingsia samuiensis]
MHFLQICLLMMAVVLKQFLALGDHTYLNYHKRLGQHIMPSLTLLHLINLPIHLLVQFSMIGIIPVLGASIISSIASLASRRISRH